MSSLADILTHLLTMKKEVSQIADKIFQESKEKCDIESYFNRSLPRQINSKLSWIRDTWYTPPANESSKVSQNFFGLPPPSILKGIEPEQINAKDGTPDIYGWVKLNNNTYYDVYLKKYQESHPFHET
ncbi:hypothetical protein CU098_010027 [Rhizopus stolonifer]|uniref:Uncharacterized protein n=1 Tax=Rhizopus stolonifer TaxID=4846 RepID=A0A367KJH9_RHIST|nr:hypothetical protein CU098_010027 [Rhizopus stolonifer]